MLCITNSGTLHREHMKPPPDEITLSITEAVSDALGAPVEELPPLSRSIDLDGLETLVSDERARDVTVTFSYAGLQVVVHSADVVYVHPNPGEMPAGERQTGIR